MGQKFTDGARAELLSAITAGATTINLASGGALFPVANAGTSPVSSSNDWFKAVLQDTSGFEIVYVRTHASGADQFTNVLRGQEGTTAKAFAATSIVGLRQTAADAAVAARHADYKVTVITGTTPAAGAQKSFPHGITPANVIGISALVDHDGNGPSVTPNWTFASGYHYQIQAFLGDAYVFLTAGNSASVANKPITFTILEKV